MINRVIIVLLCVVSFSQINAQKVELGKVTIEELKEKVYPKDTSAVAAILSKKGNTFFRYYYKKGFVSITQVAVKIKIYKKEGLKWANFEIPYYTGYKFLNDESAIINKAFTYNLENNEISKEKVAGGSKFKDKINDYWSVKKITFPNVKVGSVIEINYELRTENLSELPDFQFQYDIPVSQIEYVTEIPEFYIYKGIKTGFVALDNIGILERGHQSFENDHQQSMSISYQQIKTTYKAQDIKALKEEKYVGNVDNYLGKIKHELQIIRMPEEAPKQVATTWEDVAKSIYKEKEFGGELEKFDYFKDYLKLLLQGVEAPDKRAEIVFKYVKNRMNWNGKYGYFPKQNLELAYAEKSGNTAEINLILVAMLRMSGVDANPVLISTRENGIALFPNRSLFNAVIVALNLNGSTQLLDATDKFSDFNVLPVRDLNWVGRLIKKDGSSLEIDLMPSDNSREVINIIAAIDSKGQASGKIRRQYFDYNAFTFRQKYNGISNDSYIENLEKENQGVTIDQYEVKNSNDLSLPIIENYSFVSNNSAENIGDKIYVSPFLFFGSTRNPFQAEIREYPIDFVFPHQLKYNISLTLPEGYSVVTLPEVNSVEMSENMGDFKYNISNNGNQIQLLYTLDINQAVINAEYYAELKDFFQKMVDKQTEKIVLKKT